MLFVAAALRSYVLRRLTFMLLVVWAASTLTFLLPRMLGLTAIESRFSLPVRGNAQVSDARRAIAEQYRERFGFDRPLWSQYVRHLDRLVRFDLGYSTRYYPVTVMEILRGSVLWTLGLLAVTTIIAFGLGTVLGAFLGWPGSPWWAQAAFLPVFALSAVPYYLLALVLIFVFAFRFGWFPLAGAYTPGVIPEWRLSFAWDVLHHSLLPAISIVAAATGFWALSMRGMIVAIQGEDFLLMGQAKGLRGVRMLFRYAVRNAMLPQITGLSISLGTIMTGVVLVEVIFRYPGIGDALYRAIRNGDYFVITGLMHVTILALALATFIIDVLYPRLDPRIKARM